MYGPHYVPLLDCVAQVQELHRKLSEETRRADNLAYEMKKLEEKHETVTKEKEVRQHWHASLVWFLCTFFTDASASNLS